MELARIASDATRPDTRVVASGLEATGKGLASRLAKVGLVGSRRPDTRRQKSASVVHDNGRDDACSLVVLRGKTPAG